MLSSLRASRVVRVSAVYLAVVAATTSLAAVRLRAQAERPATVTQPVQVTKPASEYKPYFALSTNRTYSTSDRARVWINYLGIDHLDFRVYRVSDPVKFFKKLNDPHQLGEPEKREVAASLKTTPSLIERLRGFKVSVFRSIKAYFRGQLKRESREALVQKFSNEGDRRPLNVADYARVPLLNPDQLVSSWREALPPLDNEYDTRMVTLGRRDPGVYLVEAVHEGLRAYTVAVVTDLTMINKTSPSGEVLVYAADRKTGAPREGVQIEIVNVKTLASGTTNREGILKTHIERPKRSEEEEADGQTPDDQGSRDSYLIMARRGDDFAISDLSAFYFEGQEGEGESEGRALTSYIYTDRPVYRPGQKVYFKGILRWLAGGSYQLPGAGTASLVIEDPDGGKVAEKEVRLTARGSFSGDIVIAEGAPLGSYRIVVRTGDSEADQYFEIQEYKKPEYKVAVSTPKKFVPVGQKVKFTIEARYFFGEPVTNADVTYYIYRSRYYPWWWETEEEEESQDGEYDYGYGYGNDLIKDGEGRLNARGQLDVEFEVPPAEENQSWDYSYRLEAQVTDQSRRTMEARASFVGTRGSVIANTRTDRFVYYQGDTAKISIETTDYEGKPVSAALTLKFVSRRWERVETTDEEGRKRFEYKTHDDVLSSRDVTTDQQGKASVEYEAPAPGSIYISTVVKQANRQFIAGTDYVWVADRKESWSDWAWADYGSIKLVTDKKAYKPGETAKVMAMLPTDKAHLLVTTELTGVMSARHVEAPGRAVMIDVPVEARYAPNVYLSVSYVRDGEMYTSDRLLSVPATNKQLDIEIIADKKEYKPRETARYTVLARNSDGSPASGAELSLGVVDEAIYSVRPEVYPDIHKSFYGRRYNQVQTSFSISYYFSGYSGDKPAHLAAARRPAYQLADFKNEGQYAEPTIRKDFRDTTFWQPDLVTGPDGKASVEVKLPDNLTTWRATVRAVTSDTRVGSAVGKVAARKDLILRLETPRFLTEGDTATLSAVVHNYLDAAKTTEISIEVAGARLLDQATHTVTIAKQGEHRIDWRVAASAVGDVKLLAKALTDKESDAVEIPLEVVPQGLRQTRGESGAYSDDEVDKTISLELPPEAHPTARTLRIEASASIAGSLLGALDYLTSYPYGCVEQTMSSFLPNVVVTQALKEVKTVTLRPSVDLPAKVQRGLDRLYGFQHADGGWGWWKDDATDPFMTAYVVDGLVMARRAGYKVEPGRLVRGRDKLSEMLETGRTGGEDGKTIDPETRAYIVYALASSGEVDSRYVDDLFNKRAQLQPYGRALLALTLRARSDQSRARQVASEIESSASAGDFAAYWQSQRKPMLDFSEDNSIEASALSLKALSRLLPNSPILPKAARWLTANRRNGYYWDSTKQTAFAILGLIDYVKASQELAGDYRFELYVNGQQVHARQVAAGADMSPFVLDLKRDQVSRSNDIRVVKRGRGTLYVAASVSYYTGEGQIAPQSQGLTLTREYLRLRVTESADGRAKWALEPLTGELRSGDLIVSRLLVQGSRSQYLMIEDPIPAGCEQVERLSGINLNYSENGWGDWYSSREFRDQRTAFFLDEFDGKATFQYAMRVQVPGEFRVAPARAELMYQPAIRASTGGGATRIIDKK